MYVYIYTYVHIQIARDRGRERERDGHISSSAFTTIHLRIHMYSCRSVVAHLRMYTHTHNVVIYRP